MNKEQLLTYLEDYLKTLPPANTYSEPAKATYRNDLIHLIQEIRDGN